MQLLSVKRSVLNLQSGTGFLFLHGFTATPTEFVHFAKPFEEEGYSISIPLLRGHGQTAEVLNACSWYDWFEDAKQALFALRKHCTRVYVVGQSMGGTLALHLAAHYQLEGIVLLAPGLFLKARGTSFLPVIAPFRKYLVKKNGPDIKNEKAKPLIDSYDKSPVAGILELKELFAHVKADLPEVYTPTLLFHSEEDHVIDYRSSDYIYKHISSTHKRILTLKNSYHILSMDNDREIIQKEIRKFIANQVS